MKVCPTCKESKSESEFYKKTATRLQSKCKYCFNNYCIQRWIDKKKDAIEKMGGKCLDCNGVFHYAVYDFHHLKDKDLDWGKLRLRSQETIDKELKKCVLLCANCHRVRHIKSS